MSEVTLKLEAKQRDVQGRAAQVERALGWIPAVVYGHGIENRNVFLSDLAFGRVLKVAGESTLVALSIDGSASTNVLIADTQLDPLSGRVIHVDLFQVRMDEEIEAAVPLEFVGESPAVKTLGGILIRSVDTVEVKCLPANLPHALSIDLSILRDFDDRIAIADIALPAGVEILSEGDTVVATVAPPRTEAEMASLDEKVEADVTKVEGVIKETATTDDKKSDKK